MDVGTLIILFSFANLTTFFFLLYHEFTSKKKNKVIQLYALAKLFMGIAWILMALRNSAPNIVSVILGNSFLTWGSGLEILSMVLVNHNKPVRSRMLFIFGLITFLLISFFSKQPDNIKVFVYSLINGIMFIGGFVWILKQQNTSKLRFLVLGIYLHLGIILIFRGLSSILIDTSMSLTSKGLIQDISFVSFFLLLLSAIIFFLLLKEKDDIVIITNAKALSETNRLLKASNATKDKLFSIIAHDLKGPMGATAKMTDLLLNDNEELSEQDKNIILSQLVKSTNKTYELLENLLNWSRGQLNALTIDAKPFKVHALIKEVVAQLESMLHAKEQIIENNISENSKVLADYEMIKVVARNLLTNAIKFSPPDSKIIIEGNEGTSCYTIKFIDQGVGIEPDTIKNLLNPDFLISTAGTADETGTGIGLKLTKDFIEKNRGTITISSQLNEGSTFEISLPKAK